MGGNARMRRARARRTRPMEMSTMRRMTTLLAVFGVLAAAGPAVAQNYPTRPITLVVPFAAGGSASTAARSVADKIAETLGQQILVDHRAGRGGTLGTRAAAKSAADGYTILMTTSAAVGTAPSLLENLGYDARKDFEPI